MSERRGECATASRALLPVVCAVATLACTPSNGALDPALRIDFAGPGRMALIWEVEDAEGDLERHLVVYGPDTAQEISLPDPRGVRWLDRETLLVLTRPYGAELSQLWRLDDGGSATRLGEPRPYLDVEPHPDGQRLAVSVTINDEGDSALEVWSLAGDRAPRQLHRRDDSLDAPRWSPGGEGLAAALIVQPDEEESSSLALGGIAVPFPRIFAVPANLTGAPVRVLDGTTEQPDAAAAGGSIPLWWSARGIYARQRSGIVRCASPESGCVPAFELPERVRLGEARRAGADRALVLVEADPRDPLPSELWLASTSDGSRQILHARRENVYLIDLDWVAEEQPQD